MDILVEKVKNPIEVLDKMPGLTRICDCFNLNNKDRLLFRIDL